MDSSSESDEEGSHLQAEKTQWQTPVGLKPVLDGIFAEVDLNIPALDSDSSSEGSIEDEDDPLIFSDGKLRPLSSLAQSKEEKPKEDDVLIDSTDDGVRGVSVSSLDSGVSMEAAEHRSFSSDVTQISAKEDTPVKSPQKSSEQPCRPTTCDAATETDPQVPTSTDHSVQPVDLNISRLQDIDIDGLLRRLNEVCVSQDDIPELNNNDLDSDSDTSHSSEDLMKQLVSLSEKQSQESVTIPLKRTDDLSNKSSSISVQTGGLMHNAGMMTMPSTLSQGISTSPEGTGTWDVNGTRHIDLRNQNQLKGSSAKYFAAMQGSMDDSSSSSSEDEDMASWHERRKKFKEESMTKTKPPSTPSLNPKRMTSPPHVQKAKSPLEKAETKPVRENKQNDKLDKDRQTESRNKEESKSIKVKVESIGSREEEIAEVLVILKEKTPQGDRYEQKTPQGDRYEQEAHLPHEKRLTNGQHERATPSRGDEDVQKQNLQNKAIDSYGPVTRLTSSAGTETADVRPVVKQAWGEIKTAQDVSTLKNIVLEEKTKIVAQEEKLPHTKPSILQTIAKGSTDKGPATLVNGAVRREVVENGIEKKKSDDKTLKAKQLERELHAKEKKEKEKKLRMKGMLERVKQQREVKGGRTGGTAPVTPVIFDLDASYEPAPVTLPELTPTKSYLLLTATLSSCGKLLVGGNKSGNTKGSNHKNNSDSSSYNALLAWLLSLLPVPDGLECVDHARQYDVPFHVIGLQQTWHEGKLSLNIGICNRVEFSGRKQGKGNSFQAAVSKFLRTNTLADVLPELFQFTNSLMAVPYGQRNLSCMLSVNPDPDAMVRVFRTEPGFYWHTHEIEESAACEASLPSLPLCGPDVENTMTVVQYTALHDPTCMQDVFSRIWREGMDLAGVRLLYTNTDHNEICLDCSSSCVVPRPGTPVFALAMRGTCAIMRWLDVVGPLDVSLAQRTDPYSLRSLYSQNRVDHMFYCPRHTDRANTELARWFGGRVPANDTVNVGSADDTLSCVERPRSAGSRIPTSSLHAVLPSPPCTLSACSATSIVLVASPLVPACGLTDILTLCYERGFILQGIRRIRLHPNRLKDNNKDVLGLTPAQVSVFCPPNVSVNSDYTTNSYQPSFFSSACTLICLRRENGIHHVNALMYMISEQLLQGDVLPREVVAQGHVMLTQLCFTAVPFTEHLLAILGHKIDHLPNSGIYTAAFLSHSFYSSPELEQVCVVTLLKEKATQDAHRIIRYLLQQPPRQDTGEVYCGLELLGIKLITSLSQHQAKEFSPYEIGDRLWQSSLKPLTTGPALICALRGVNAFSRVRTFIHSYVGGSPRKQAPLNKSEPCPHLFMSPTPEIAYRQLTAIFHEHELHADHAQRINLHLLPPPRQQLMTARGDFPESMRQKEKKAGLSKGSDAGRGRVETISPDDVHIISSLLEGPRPFTTVCVIKPDAVPRHIGKVLRRLVREGFTIVNMKMMCLTKTEAALLVSRDPDCDRDNTEVNVRHMTSGPALAVSVQRENAVGKLLEVLGPSIPDEARVQSQFFLRGSYGTDRVKNALYASSSYEHAVRDNMLLFREGLCCSPSIDLQTEEIPCLDHDVIFDVKTARSLMDVTSTMMPCDTDYFMDTLHLPASLLEVNCILLHPSLLQPQGPGSASGRHVLPGYADVIDALLAAGLQPIGMRMLQMNETQAAQCVRFYTDTLHADIKPYKLAFQLYQGPCVVLAVLRDGAVTSFDTLLNSLGKNKSIATKYGRQILAARSTKQARRLVECFFNRLMPNRKLCLEIAVN